jgi:aspartate racemase
MANPVIGILAGMGPRSTGPFVDLVVDACQRAYNAKNDIDFPQMVILSHPTPFYLDRPIDHEVLKQSVIDGLLKLESCGVNFIAMPCNSAHIYFKELESAVSTPLLNIVTETLAHVPSGSRATLFATAPTFECGIYQRGFEQAGCEFVFNKDWQGRVTSILLKIKSGEIGLALREWKALIDSVQATGVDKIVSACTDLNVVARLYQSDTTIIDSAKSLAEATVSRYLKEKV